MAGGTGELTYPTLRADGAQAFPNVASESLGQISALFDREGRTAGLRFTALGDIQHILSTKGSVGNLVSDLIGVHAKPVRLIAFDKSDGANWSLGWHQDRTICVKERHNVIGFGPWTKKQGLHHVQPPFAILAGMITVRIHVDPVDAANAPLLVALGSHVRGLIPEQEVAKVVAESTQFSCLAAAGDVWLYSTPILHSSHRAAPGRRRRVLQIDYCDAQLPSPLEWLLS